MLTSGNRTAGSLLAVLTIAVLGSTCQKSQAEASAEPGARTANPTGTVAAATSPDDVLVTVNGATLTRLRADTDQKMRLDAVRKQVPPEKIPAVSEQVYRTVVEQFIIRELLMAEAKRRELTVTDADRSNAYAKISANLPEGMTVENAMRNSPMGEERMREEVEAGLLVTKLLVTETSNGVTVTDQDVAAFREKNKENLQMPEKVRVSHILFSVTDKDDEAAKAEKMKKAEEVREQLVGGADFAELAAKYSSCPSKQRGGDLGLFDRGKMVKEFEAAAFSQPVGEIGPVVTTKFGYHIIKVTEHDQPQTMADTRIKELLEKKQQREATKAFINRLRGQAQIEIAPELKDKGIGLPDASGR